jgi:hypothetical protein
MEQLEQSVSALDLRSEDGAAVSVEVVGYAAVFAAVIAVIIAAGPQIGQLIVQGIQSAIQSVTGGGAAG